MVKTSFHEQSSPLRLYGKPLNISSWAVFVVSLALYWITSDPGASYWDCPEYVVVASRLEIGHPPGNPIWMLTMRIATMPFPPHLHALVINLCSGLFMAFSAFFLCRIIFIPTRLFFQTDRLLRSCSIGLRNWIAGIISAGSSLCFALCDSVWFSAVEAEVYAMSTFLSALSLWIITLWWWAPSRQKQFRLLVLLAYITGISLGVHQLNLLLLPVFALILLYKQRNKVSPAMVIVVFLFYILLIGIILMGVMPGVLFGAGKFELWAVNGLGLPYNSGVVIFSILILFLFLILIYLGENSSRPQRRFLLCVWSVLFLLLGYSSFGIILIRSEASPPMNEGAPDNIFALASYVARDQYPSTPLFYGHTPYSQPLLIEEIQDGRPVYSLYALKKGKPVYQRVEPGARLEHRSRMLSNSDSSVNEAMIEKGKGYVLSDYKFQQILTPELDMWWPRITSRNVNDRMAYEDWAGATEETMTRVRVSEAVDSLGNPVSKLDKNGNRIEAYSYRPTYYQNLKYFVAYQAYYMYFRYLFWNFIGRQNDFPSMGEIEHGNFLTGFPVIDSNFLGDTKAMPKEIGENNPGRNRYFGIPFLLGIIGIFYLGFSNRRNRRLLTVIGALFLMTGLAIVFYLNQTPGEPRERDYTFLVSYMAFTLWIAAGILGVAKGLMRLVGSKKPGNVKAGKRNRRIGMTVTIAILIVLSVGTPGLMAVENFDNNDRRGRFETTFYASSILDFEYPAVIFSQGDNHSFPFWYATEVLGMGEQHTPIDITYLSMPSYVVNLKRQGKKGITTIGTTPELAYGKYQLTKIPSDSDSEVMPLGAALKKLYESDNARWPTSLIAIPASDSLEIIINLHDFSRGSSYLGFKHLMLLELIETASGSEDSRALFFPSAIDGSFYKPIVPVLKPALFGSIYAPEISDSITVTLMQAAVSRELHKLHQPLGEVKTVGNHYTDPVTADRSRRYRGEMTIAAQRLMEYGDTALASQVADAIISYFPYESLLPGDFTISDTTFYEGTAFSRLMRQLGEARPSQNYSRYGKTLDSLMNHRHKEWLRYYHSLPPSQRNTLSNRSRRLLIPPAS